MTNKPVISIDSLAAGAGRYGLLVLPASARAVMRSFCTRAKRVPMLPTVLVLLTGFFIAVHLATLLIAWRRCRQGAGRSGAAQREATPPVTVVRPLCGVETFSARTIEAAFALDYPAYELLFCVARADDPVVPLVETAIAAHADGAVSARLLVGDDRIGTNPKLNNMVKGWRHAAFDRIAFIDSNVLVPRGFLRDLVATVRPDTAVVSAPPCGIEPDGFGAHLECAFLNTHEARWQYAVDTFGQGFAQGKTLFYRKADLDRSGMRDLAAEPAEDAATTKMVRAMGMRVRLAPPSPQPLGRRPIRHVWDRQLRWARLRRATFPVAFLPEILAGTVLPAITVAAAAASLGWPVMPVLAAFAVAWYAAEAALALGCGWPMGWRGALAMLARDAVLPVLFVGAFTGSSFTWNGTVVRMRDEAPAEAIDPTAAV